MNSMAGVERPAKGRTADDDPRPYDLVVLNEAPTDGGTQTGVCAVPDPLKASEHVTRTACLELPAAPASVSFARNTAASWLILWGLSADAAEIARLLVSELATNAVDHSVGPKVVVSVIDSDEWLEIRVKNPAGNVPALTASLPADSSERGRGLFLVATLADDWGTADDQVWARLTRIPAGVAA
jgi:anti-sigma regulatory factor (Ser/Thr protein kinase)